MNILGEGFPDIINEQVRQRQKVYGSGYIDNRTPEQIVYLNGNTSWCKLVSSVDIVDPKVVRNDTVKELNLGGSELAERFVLFNGTDNIAEKLRSGIDYTQSTSGNNNAYGIGGTEFGLRPMMGIQSAEIKHENRGSIRRATVKIKAWNKKQFDIIDALYLRLGFDILLEWGHTMYYDSKGELHTGNTDLSLALDFLTGKNQHPSSKKKGVKDPLTYDNFLKLIDYQRLVSNGNYDAMFAKVTNFHWSFMPDGSYDIILDLVSIGDVIESFKINVLSNGINNAKNNIVTGSNIADLADYEIITLFANKHSIGQYFYKLMYKENYSQKGQEVNTAENNRSKTPKENIEAGIADQKRRQAMSRIEVLKENLQGIQQGIENIFK